MGGFVHLDERQDVLLSLEHCAMSLRQTERSKGEWKWVVLSLHSAFQGAMVCHLSGSELRGALREKHAQKTREWLERYRQRRIEGIQEGVEKEDHLPEEEDHFPNEELASPLELLDRLGCLEKRIENGVGGVISITSQQKESFKEFHKELRNNFTHFCPSGWNIEIDLIKVRMRDVLDIFDLIKEDPYPFRHMSCDEKSAMHTKLADIRSFLQ